MSLAASRLLLCLTLIAALFGCRAAPEHTPPPSVASRGVPVLTITRLNPAGMDEPADAGRPTPHGVEALDTQPVTDPALARRIRQLLADPTTYDGPAHRPCFLPRLLVHDGDTDYVLCAQCGRADIYRPHMPVESLALTYDAADAFDALMNQVFPTIPAASATQPRRF